MGDPSATKAIRLRFTFHGEQRLSERGISREEVERVVAGREVVYDRRDGCREYMGSSGERRLKVVVDPRTDPWEVITVHTL